jgi:hypothetical protein
MCLALWQRPPLPFVSDRAYFAKIAERYASRKQASRITMM